MAEKKNKEVKKDDVLKYSEVYNEHFTEKMLVEKAKDFVHNFLFANNIYGKESDWEGGRAVYGQLPFGDSAVYVVKTSNGIVKATVTSLIDNDAETITLGVDAPGCKHGEKVIEHLTIKHGYVNWYELDAPNLDIQENTTPVSNTFKDTLPKFEDVKPRMKQQPQFPLYMMPFF